MTLLKPIFYVSLFFGLGAYSGLRADENVATFITNTSEPYFSTIHSLEGRAEKVMKILSERAGVKYRIEFMPLKRVVNTHAPFVIGDPDIFIDERERAVFPIDVISSAFFYYQPNNQKLNFDDVSKLRGKKMGVLRGSLENTSFFEKNNIQIEKSNSIDSLLGLLVSNRIDFCILLKESGDYAIQKNYTNYVNDFKSEVVPASHVPISIMVDKDSKRGMEIAKKYKQVIFDVMSSSQVKEVIDAYYLSDVDSRKHYKYLNFFIKQYHHTWPGEW